MDLSEVDSTGKVLWIITMVLLKQIRILETNIELD